MTWNAEFLRRGHPQLAEALQCMPVSDRIAGPVLEVVAQATAPLTGNGSAKRWGWILLVDQTELDSFAYVEAIEHNRTGFAPAVTTDYSLSFDPPQPSFVEQGRQRSVGISRPMPVRFELRGRESVRLAARSKAEFRPKRLTSSVGDMLALSNVRVGGVTRQGAVYQNGVDRNLWIGTILPFQTVTVDVRNADARRVGVSISMRGRTKTWFVFASEHATRAAALARSRPELRRKLAMQ